MRIIGKYYCLPILFSPITMVFHLVISLSPVTSDGWISRSTHIVLENLFSEGISDGIYLYTGGKLLL
jgi:hypothetical protein